jgi:CMP-N,N'-diacetyllegionaminic acid synthase
MNILITICGRGGSKGIPGKNIRFLAGKPLIAYSIEVAHNFSEKYAADIALSTDDAAIKQVAADYGLVSNYTRPAELSTDNAGKIETIYDLLSFEERNREKRYDYILDLDITSPLRHLEDLETALLNFQKDEKAANLFSVNFAARNPYFNMVEQQPNGYYGLVKTGKFLTRQSAPAVYDLNASFYFYRRSFFERGKSMTINEHSMIYVMPHICFDLDNPIDFDFMEYLVVNDKLGFCL